MKNLLFGKAVVISESFNLHLACLFCSAKLQLFSNPVIIHILCIFAVLKNRIHHSAFISTMQQTKIVKVFLASSITELQDERRDISALGDDISNLFSHDNIAVRFIKCENIHEGNIGQHDQKVIDQKIQGCDLSMFVFKTKAGEWTCHEYEVARSVQQERRHEIFVYFLRVPEDEKHASLTAFQQQLDEEGVFWTECDNLSEVKHNFSMGILTHLGITIGDNTPEVEAVAKSGDDLFAQYEQEEAQQMQRQQQLHQAIDDLLAQIPSIMSVETESISARIIEVVSMYEKADRWAAKTKYDKDKYSHLLFDYAQFLDKYGLYRDAEDIYLRQIDIAEELYGTEHENTAASYNNIGLVYEEQGDYSKSLEYYFKALKTREMILGIEHPDTAASYNNIGGVYDDQGDYNRALEYYLKALAIWKKVFGTEHPATATSYNNIGLVYFEQGNYGKSLEYHFKALTTREKVLGIEHPDTATSYNNIGLVYTEQGDFVKALEYLLKALLIHEKVYGTEHPATATSYNNIGVVYNGQGYYGKALECYFKALAIHEKVHGIDHPETATSYNNVSMVYYRQGDYKKALEYLNKAYLIYEKVFGSKHPDTENALIGIDIVKRSLGSND